MKKSQKMRGLISMIAVALSIDFIVLFGSNLSWGSQVSYCWYFSVKSDCSYLGLATYETMAS